MNSLSQFKIIGFIWEFSKLNTWKTIGLVKIHYKKLLTSQRVTNQTFQRLATEGNALQRAPKPVYFQPCQTTSQRLKTAVVVLVKAIVMRSRIPPQRAT